MSLAKNRSGIKIPDRMRNKLERFQKKVWIIKLTEGVLAAAFGLLVSYLLVFVIDRFFDTPAVARAAILIVGALGLGLWFPLVCHKWIWKSRKLEQVARLLKHDFPRLGDHLLGIIQLVNNTEESSRSEALTRAALAQVDEETKDREFANAVPYPKHVRWALIAGVPAAIVIAALVLVPAASGNALARWLTPWKHTPRYTFAQIEKLPKRIVVPVAENASLSATLASTTQWSPETGSASVGGARLVAPREDGKYGFEIPPLKEPSTLEVSIGDIRETVEITPLARPELAKLMANITLPDYLQRTESVIKDIRGGVVSMVTGSEVEFIGTASRDIATATADGNAIRVDGARMLTTPVSVDASRVMEFQWKDAAGLTAKQPLKLKIRSESDQEPSLVCRQLEQQRVIMEKDVLTFEVDASDDFGVKTVGMQWEGDVGNESNYEAAVGEKIVAAGSPESSDLTVMAAFSPERLRIQPQVIQLRLFVQDYLPGREPIYSPAYTVFVLSEADHSIWLTSRMDEWFKQSLETYEREQQLFKRNTELRNMTASELDRPENRNKIQAQATSEQAQQRRLEALIELGTELTKDATRNDQFNVATLEKLSGMLEALDDIAKNRMPSVSDMLKEAADAAAGQTQSQDPQQGSSESNPSDSKPGESKPDNAPSVDDIKGSPAGEGGSEPDDEEKPKVPSINIRESSMDKPEKGEPKSDEAPPSKSGARLTLPSVDLQDNAAPSDQPAEAAPSPAGEKMKAAVDAQEELLAEFQKVAEELKQIIENLEGSTFVKRLKTMSRRQLELAQDVNEMTVKEFGNSELQVKKPIRDRSELLSKRELVHLTTVANIRDDLEAYANRVNEGKFKTVLEEMKTELLEEQLTDIADRIVVNQSGGSIAHLELLADTFDRWAEQIVGPG